MNRQRDLEESYEDQFAARLTAVSSASGRPRYTWHEVEPSFFGVYTDLSNGRSGDDLVNYMVEMNDRAVAVPLVVQARLRGADEQTQVFEFEAPQGASSGGGLTVQNKDGTQLGTASSLVLDQTTGLRVLNITGGAANLQNDAATVSGAGVVTTQAQTMTGDKSFQGTYNLPAIPQGGTDTVLIGGSGTRMGASGGYGPYIRLRMQITSGSGAGGDSNMYLAPTQVILAAPPLALDSNNNITALSGPGLSSAYGGVSLLPSFADSVPRRATARYTSPNLDFVLDTAGLGQAARFVINDNAGNHPGVSVVTGGLTFTGGILTGGTITPPAGGVPTTRVVATTAPLTGGGDLSADRTLAVLAQNSVTAAAAGLQLVNDAAAPGNSVYYGTDKTGAKGYFALPVSTQSAVWRYSTNTTIADPTAGNFRINTALFSSATLLALSSTTDAGTDVSNTLKALAVNDTIQIQDQSAAANWARYKITSAVNNTTWFQFGVSYVAGGGTAPTNNTPALITVTVTGGGAAGGTLTVQDEGVTLSTTATTLNFTGAGVTASGSGASITVNVPGGGGGAGTVTSIDVSGGSTGLTTSGGPVTASGTITLAGTLAVANGGTGSTSAAAALTALGAAPSSRTISTTAPLAGGGDLSANRTLTVSTFTSGASGVVPASGGGTTNFLRADGTWAAAAPTTRAVNTTAPLAGGGDLSADRTLSITNFTSSAAGAVPASGGGTTAFLRADGSWAAPPGGGGGLWAVSSQSASFTAATTPTSYYCSSASGSITGTLPPAAGNAGLRLHFTKTSASSSTNLVTVKGNASENITSSDGAANTLVLYYQADEVELECDGTGWYTAIDRRRPHLCSVRRAAAQSMPDNPASPVTIVFDTATQDALGMFSGGAVFVKRGGTYQVHAYWGMSGTNVQLYIYKGGLVLGAVQTNAAATSYMTNTIVGYLTLAAGDAVYAQGVQVSGGAQNTGTAVGQIPMMNLLEIR